MRLLSRRGSVVQNGSFGVLEGVFCAVGEAIKEKMKRRRF
jgi:hypothetical protein